jgi:N,N-dimethylformamidase
MTESTRREFLLTTGSAIAAGATLGQFTSSSAGDIATTVETPKRATAAAMPPHRALPVSGVHVYTDKPSYSAGESLTAFISASIPCDIEVVRLGDDLDSPALDEVLHRLKIEQPAMQPVHPGSYIHIEKGVSSQPIAALTLECWIRPWHITEPQAVISQLNDSNGFGLLIFPDGALGFFTGECLDPVTTPHRTSVKLDLPDAPTFNSFLTPPASWQHVVAVFGGGVKSLWVNGRRVGIWEHKVAVVPAPCSLRIGALGRAGQAAGLLDADIAMPAIYSRALNEDEIRTRNAERGLTPPGLEPDLLGCWPFNEERGSKVADISGASRAGRIINHATWMIGGPSFLPVVARYRRDYNPDQDATRGHGLRLASDDLYDCGWQPTFSFVIPKTAKSGLFAVRGRFSQDGKEFLTHAVFVVRREPSAAPAPIALLFSTNTWKAYSGAPFGPAWPDVFADVGNRGYQPKPTDPLAPYCFYRFHRAGQPTYQLGWQLPWPAASPYALVSTPDVGYSHLSRADRFTQRWFEQNHYAFDALSDLDLHRNPGVLDGVKVLYMVGHSEYWTREAMQHVREFLNRGGKVVCLSGNTMYWRVTHSDDDSILECRKADAWGAQLADYMRGECWHEHDHKRGGVPRDCGDPEWQTLGVEFTGANSMSATSDGAFHVVDATHPFFHQPHETGLSKGDRFAFDASHPGRQPIGHETDVRVSTLMDFTRRLPPLVGLPTDLKDPNGIHLLAVGRYGSNGQLGAARDYAHRVLPPNLRKVEDSLCDVIHWTRAEGGQVFAAPSIAAGWTLSACPKWDKLMKNVLDHFGVSKPSVGR